MKFISFYSLLITAILLYACDNNKQKVNTTNDAKQEFEDTIQRISKKELLFGFDMDLYDIIRDTVKPGWTFSHLLAPYGVSQYQINIAAENAADSLINLKYVVDGRPFTILTDKDDTTAKARHLIYEPDVYSYVVFNFEEDTVVISRKEKDIVYTPKYVHGHIEKNSNLTMELSKWFENYNITAELADKIEGIFAWSIDFFRLQPNDKFVVHYIEKSIDDQPYGVDKIDRIWFEHSGKGKYAFLFKTDSVHNIKGYYDETGKEMKRPFLMSPVKFARISSGYNLNRVHPIYKKRKPHLGTDYAAPTGTPIMATADGTVTKASRSGGNGIYVKLRHNKTYETQYLHMSKIADGIKPGVRVEQGQTIGFVGSTGAATGPHVCYRFWKNGKQINHRAETFPDSEPMADSLLPSYKEFIAPLKNELDSIISKEFPKEEVAAEI